MTKETEERFKKEFGVDIGNLYIQGEIINFISSELFLQRKAIEKEIEGMKCVKKSFCQNVKVCSYCTALTDVLDIIKGKE